MMICFSYKITAFLVSIKDIVNFPVYFIKSLNHSLQTMATETYKKVSALILHKCYNVIFSCILYFYEQIHTNF